MSMINHVFIVYTIYITCQALLFSCLCTYVVGVYNVYILTCWIYIHMYKFYCFGGAYYLYYFVFCLCIYNADIIDIATIIISCFIYYFKRCKVL